MIKINSETKFVRSATYTNEKGVKVNMIFQPYIIGIYLAIYEGNRIACQSSIAYSNIPKLTKNFENDLTKAYKDVTVSYSTLGNFLAESELKYLK